MSLIIGYWNIRGRAECLRILLHYLKVDYKEENYSIGPAPRYDKSAWLKAKYAMNYDYPNLPYLVDGDFKLTELSAILKYISEKYDSKLLGINIQQKAVVEMTMGVLYDLRTNFVKILENGRGGKEEKECQPPMLATILNIADVLNRDKYLAGNNITYVDFVCAEFMECINDCLEPVFQRYPSIKRHFEEISNLPGVKEFKETRKNIPYQLESAKIGGKIK